MTKLKTTPLHRLGAAANPSPISSGEVRAAPLDHLFPSFLFVMADNLYSHLNGIRSVRLRPAVLILALTALLMLNLPMPGSVLHARYAAKGGDGWQVVSNPEDRWISIISKDGSQRVFVDGDGPEDDEMYAGVYIRLGEREFSGNYLGTKAPLLAPENPFLTQSRVYAEAKGREVEITMLDDSSLYRPGDPHSAVSSLRMEVSITFGPDIVITLRGLYYILPVGVETFTLWIDEDERVYHRLGDGPYVDYFEDVRFVEFTDSQGAHFVVETDARVLQFESLPPMGDPQLRVSEIDFDHSYKEYGQAEILTTVLLLPPPGASPVLQARAGSPWVSALGRTSLPETPRRAPSPS